MDSSAPILKLLREQGLLKVAPPQEVLRRSSDGPLRVLAKMRLIDELGAIKAIAEKLKIDFVDLCDASVESRITPSKFGPQVKSDICIKHKCVPLWEDGGSVVAALANPFDQEASKALEFALARPIKVVVAEELKILKIVAQFFEGQQSSRSELQQSTEEAADSIEFVGPIRSENELNVSETDAPPVIKLCNRIILDAVKLNASDIHIEPAQFGLVVRYRVDGVMRQVLEIPVKIQPHIISRIKLLSGMDISERRRPQDGRIRGKASGEEVDLRVSSLPTAHGEKLVLRLLRSDGKDLSLGSLNLPPKILERLKLALESRSKLLLVTGPTGSGKTTTLYSCLTHLRNGTTNIETVEDPIEYRFGGINQVQVNDAIGVTFASALRSILRQDPDVIMIGEIRDSETANIALQAAQTGHLVLSTLHTNDAPSALLRLRNLEVDTFTLSSVLAGIIAQRLVRKICTNCKTLVGDDYIEQHRALIKPTGLVPSMLFYGKGCDACGNTGYRGRHGLYSYLEINQAISQMVFDGKPLQSIIMEARRSGYQSVDEAGIELVRQGITSFDEIRPYLFDRTTAAPTQTVVAEQEKPKAAAIAVPAEANSPAKGVQKQKLVLIEDDDNVRTILSMVLNKEMFEVFEAENGQEGLNLVYEKSPDIVLCDLMMPTMDGREFLARMKNNKSTKDIPVIILTAVDTEQNEIELLNLGAQDFVSKTSSATVMLSRINRALKAD